MNARGQTKFSGDLPTRVRRQAAEWLALREARGFTTKEHADFSEWMAADARHRAAFAEVAAGWRRFDGLAALPHSADAAPDPDLLAPVRPGRSWRMPLAWAAAAVLAVSAAWWLEFRPAPETPATEAAVAVAPRVLRLRDGSAVELNAGAEVVEQFTTAERRIRLVRGEAHFTVAKNPARPFVVEAGTVTLRALGTAFNVRLDAAQVEVLVTHGRVQVAPPPKTPGADEASIATIDAPVLEAQQRVSVPLVPVAETIAVETLAPAELDRALAWQTSRIAFENLPLAEVLARFEAKRGGRFTPRVQIADPRLAALRISGRVRADDIEGLVEVLETSFGVVAERRADGEIVLRMR